MFHKHGRILIARYFFLLRWQHWFYLDHHLRPFQFDIVQFWFWKLILFCSHGTPKCQTTNIVVKTIDVIYCYVIWIDNASMLPEAITRRQEEKYPTIKVLQGGILKLLNSVNSVPILYRAGNMQSAIFIVHRLFLPTTMWVSIYPPVDALLYQSICSI